MLHHVIALRFIDGTTDEQVQRLVEGLTGLQGRIDTIRTMRMGRDLRIRADNFDFASVIEFDDEAGYLEFRDHPAHQHVVRDCIRPITAERAGVVFLSPANTPCPDSGTQRPGTPQPDDATSLLSPQPHSEEEH